MKTIVFDSIVIINKYERKAKIVNFKSGINVICGNESNKGNWIGKSSLIRSLYHTLGADCKFSSEWKKSGKVAYILLFKYDSKNYVMSRLDRSFKLFENDKELFLVNNRNDLSNELNKLFNKEIYLMSQNDEYALATPAFNYLLTYLDQQDIKEFDFKSFDGLGEFKKFYNDLVYSHLGFPSKDIQDTRVKIESGKNEMEEAKRKKDLLNGIYEEITKSNTSLPLNIEALKVKFDKYKSEYENLLKEASKLKNSLLKSYNAKMQIENTIKEFNDVISSKEKNVKSIIKKHQCPTCHSKLSDSSDVYFEETSMRNDYEFHLREIQNELVLIEREITIKAKKYEEKIKEVNSLENEIFKCQSSINGSIETIGYRALENKISLDISENEKKINLVQTTLSSLNKELRKLKSIKKNIDAKYLDNLTFIVRKYNVPLNLEKITSAESVVRSNSSEGLFITIAWLLSLLETKYFFNKDSTIYPIIYDNINDADLGKSNDVLLFRMLFDHLPVGGQIITSKALFNPDDFKEYSINQIILDNPTHHLLNEQDYDLAMSKFSKYL